MVASSETSIDARTRVTESGGQMSTPIDGQVVVMRIADGRYFAMEDVAARVWELLAEPIAVADL